MLDFLLKEMATGKLYATGQKQRMRILILLKLTQSPQLKGKFEEFKKLLSKTSEDLRPGFYKQMEDVVNGNY
jgi:hypothetical protein